MVEGQAFEARGARARGDDLGVAEVLRGARGGAFEEGILASRSDRGHAREHGRDLLAQLEAFAAVSVTVRDDEDLRFDLA